MVEPLFSAVSIVVNRVRETVQGYSFNMSLNTIEHYFVICFVYRLLMKHNRFVNLTLYDPILNYVYSRLLKMKNIVWLFFPLNPCCRNASTYRTTT